MLTMLVTLSVHPDQRDAFIAAITTNAANSRQEPGCRRFEVLCQADAPLNFVLVEVYDDEAARQAHFTTEHYRQWKAVSSDFFSSKVNLVYNDL